MGKLGGGYNPHLQTSLPEHLQIYNPANETSESSHRAFTTTFPRGFALEVVQLYCGPPQIVLKFRHWGFMEGQFKQHAPTGEMIELFGIAIFEVYIYLSLSISVVKLRANLMTHPFLPPKHGMKSVIMIC